MKMEAKAELESAGTKEAMSPPSKVCSSRKWDGEISARTKNHLRSFCTMVSAWHCLAWHWLVTTVGDTAWSPFWSARTVAATPTTTRSWLPSALAGSEHDGLLS